MLTAIVFVVVNVVLYLFALARGPIWGLYAYAIIYFNSPDPKINWWGEYIPNFRWSLITAIIIVVSAFIHKSSLAKDRMYLVNLIIAFLVLTAMITVGFSVNREQAGPLTYKILAYCLIVLFLVKCLRSLDDLRQFTLLSVGLAGSLSLKAMFEGKRIHARLENIGPADAISSNEFGMLLAAILPMALPFILKGKWFERIVCIIATVLCMNAFVLCNSRGAFVSLACGALYAAFVSGRKARNILFICVMCGSAATLYLADEYFIQRISTLWNSEMSAEDSINTLSTGRLAIWQYGLTMARDNPLGVGPDGFRELSRFYMPQELLTFHPGADHGVRAAHNSYLQVLVEQGILGLIIFLAICWYPMYLLYKSLKNVHKKEMSDEFIGLYLLSISMSLAISLIGGVFGAQVYYEYFWWQIALAVVASSVANDLTHASDYPQGKVLSSYSGLK